MISVTVTAQIKIDVYNNWGDDATIKEVRTSAVEKALSQLNNALFGTDITVLTNSTTAQILLEEEKGGD